MDNGYRVVYINKLQQDAVFEEVVGKLSDLFKITPAKAEDLLKGKKPIIIKNNISKELASKYQEKLSIIGLQVITKRSLNAKEPSEKVQHSKNSISKDVSNEVVGKNRDIEETISNKSITAELGIKEKQQNSISFLNNLELNVYTRLIISIIIAISLTTYVFLTSSYRGEKLVFYFVGTCIPLYILTGMFNIYNKKAKALALCWLITGTAYPFFKNYQQGKPILELIFVTLFTAGGLALISRIVAHLICPPQLSKDNPQLFEEIRSILDNQWITKFENQISTSTHNNSNIIPHIYKILKKKNSTNLISAYLATTMKQTIGVKIDIELNNNIANAIVETHKKHI